MVLSKDGFSTVSEKTGQPHVSARCGPHEGFIVDEGIRLLVDGRTFDIATKSTPTSFGFRVDLGDEPVSTVIMSTHDGSVWALVTRLDTEDPVPSAVLLDSSPGQISGLCWKGPVLAWSTTSGVKVMNGISLSRILFHPIEVSLPVMLLWVGSFLVMAHDKDVTVAAVKTSSAALVARWASSRRILDVSYVDQAPFTRAPYSSPALLVLHVGGLSVHALSGEVLQSFTSAELRRLAGSTPGLLTPREDKGSFLPSSSDGQSLFSGDSVPPKSHAFFKLRDDRNLYCAVAPEPAPLDVAQCLELAATWVRRRGYCTAHWDVSGLRNKLRDAIYGVIEDAECGRAHDLTVVVDGVFVGAFLTLDDGTALSRWWMDVWRRLRAAVPENPAAFAEAVLRLTAEYKSSALRGPEWMEFDGDSMSECSECAYVEEVLPNIKFLDETLMGVVLHDANVEAFNAVVHWLQTCPTASPSILVSLAIDWGPTDAGPAFVAPLQELLGPFATLRRASAWPQEMTSLQAAAAEALAVLYSMQRKSDDLLRVSVACKQVSTAAKILDALDLADREALLARFLEKGTGVLIWGGPSLRSFVFRYATFDSFFATFLDSPLQFEFLDHHLRGGGLQDPLSRLHTYFESAMRDPVKLQIAAQVAVEVICEQESVDWAKLLQEVKFVVESVSHPPPLLLVITGEWDELLLALAPNVEEVVVAAMIRDFLESKGLPEVCWRRDFWVSLPPEQSHRLLNLLLAAESENYTAVFDERSGPVSSMWRSVQSRIPRGHTARFDLKDLCFTMPVETLQSYPLFLDLFVLLAGRMQRQEYFLAACASYLNQMNDRLRHLAQKNAKRGKVAAACVK
ncbi:MAG: hypothetical protein KVP17_000340 [Porospora cf. gigantea B]|uniref:uncharacterized protein n=1 Tax=Porospora cf. gigantea B TaxID=2853592 RepID=UPI003571C731|nr:MAG: hypothetical protein KVP17_000340 [Porospora cf. gigantea B]